MTGCALDDAWRNAERVGDTYWPNFKATSYAVIAVSLAAEVGEVCDVVKRIDAFGSQGKPFDVAELLEEMADTQAYLIRLCQRAGVSGPEFAAALNAKMAKVEARMLAQRRAP